MRAVLQQKLPDFIIRKRFDAHLGHGPVFRGQRGAVIQAAAGEDDAGSTIRGFQFREKIFPELDDFRVAVGNFIQRIQQQGDSA